MDENTQQPVAQSSGQTPVQPLPAKNNGLAITSMVLGILSILIAPWPMIGIVGILLGIAALILAIIAKKQIKASMGTQKGSGMAITGLVLGIISIVLGGIVLACSLAFFNYVNNSSEFNDILNEIESMPIE